MLNSKSLRQARKERLARQLNRTKASDEQVEENVSESAYRWNPLVQKPAKLGRRPTGGGWHWYGPPPDAGTTYGMYSCHACGMGVVAPDKEEAIADKEPEEALYFCPSCSTAMEKDDTADSETTATVLENKAKMTILPACPSCGTVVMTSADVVNKDVDRAYCIKCGTEMTSNVRDLQIETLAEAVRNESVSSTDKAKVADDKEKEMTRVEREMAAIMAEIEEEKKAAPAKTEPAKQEPVAAPVSAPVASPVAEPVKAEDEEEEPKPEPEPEAEGEEEAPEEDELDKEIESLVEEIEKEKTAPEAEGEEEEPEEPKEDEDVPPEPVAEEEAPEEPEEPEASAVRYEILSDLNDDEEVSADSVQMTLYDAEDADPYYNIDVNGRPVGQLRLSDIPNSEEIRSAFVGPDYSKAIVSAMIKVGAKKILETVGARLWAHKIDESDVVKRATAAADDKAKNEVLKSLENLKEEYLHCIGIVSAGMDCNFFRGESHPLKEALWTVLGELGVPESRRISAIEKAMKIGSRAYHEAILAKAIEYTKMTPQALSEIERAIGDMDTLPPEVDEVESEDEPEEEEETMATRMAKASAVLGNVPGFTRQSPKDKMKNRLGLGGAGPRK